MKYVISITAIKKPFFIVTKLVLLTAIAVSAPLLKNQFITGTIVNACLYCAVFFIPFSSAVISALVPSLVAVSIGLLPLALAPAIPFIMTANVILMTVFKKLYRKNYLLAVIGASLIKFLFLFSTSRLIILNIVSSKIVSKVIVMLSWPQMVTALAGGLISFAIYKARF